MVNEKIISNSVERLEDIALERVFGGVEWDSVVNVAGPIALFSAPVSLVFGVGSAICQYRGKKRREQGNIDRADKLSKAGIALSSMATGTAAVATIGAGIVFGTRIHDEIFDK